MTRMLLIGPPGSGKGTQAERISTQLGIIAISTGEIFRENVRTQTKLGAEARKYMDKGDFVPDRVTNSMVRDRLAQTDAADGFLLDGYPRTVSQAQFLDQVLADKGQRLDSVLQLTADSEELLSRLLKRAAVDGRTDDTETVIRHRLGLYHHQTETVVSHYRRLGLLRQVDGTGPIEEITGLILTALGRGPEQGTVDQSEQERWRVNAAEAPN